MLPSILNFVRGESCQVAEISANYFRVFYIFCNYHNLYFSILKIWPSLIHIPNIYFSLQFLFLTGGKSKDWTGFWFTAHFSVKSYEYFIILGIKKISWEAACSSPHVKHWNRSFTGTVQSTVQWPVAFFSNHFSSAEVWYFSYSDGEKMNRWSILKKWKGNEPMKIQPN